jgi:Patatin-like phospholipase
MSLVVQSGWLSRLRDSVYSALRESIDGKKDRNKLTWLDKINPLCQQLSYLYETIAVNPRLREIFLATLTTNIQRSLGNGENYNVYISAVVKNLTPDNFPENLALVESKVWHTGVIYFLEECIREWKVTDQVKIAIQARQKDSLEYATLADLDYVNLSSLRAFHEKINKWDGEWVSFSLSGGISNAFSQLGIIRRTLASWQKIRAIVGTSMGGILAVLVSRAIDRDWDIEKLITTLKTEFQSKWKLYVKKTPWKEANPRLSTKPVDQRYDIRDIFTKIATEYGITENMTFDELNIPVAVNASYQSEKHTWEKEIILSGGEKIMDSVRVWANMPGMSTDNHGILGRQAVRWLAMVDFAANEQWNPLPLLTRIGIARKWIVGVDVGYSSVNYNTKAAQFSRFYFPDALVRDFWQKFALVDEWGSMYEMDAEPSNNSSGSDFSADIIDALIENWEQAYDAKNLPQK